MSLEAYTRTQTVTENTREREYRLFAQVTRALVEAAKSEERNQSFFKAVDWNRRLWSTLSSDCGLPGNQLPKEVRASLISLALWVGRHSSQVALGKAGINDLIDVNRNVMAGLRLQSE